MAGSRAREDLKRRSWLEWAFLVVFLFRIIYSVGTKGVGIFQPLLLLDSFLQGVAGGKTARVPGDDRNK